MDLNSRVLVLEKENVVLKESLRREIYLLKILFENEINKLKDEIKELKGVK